MTTTATPRATARGYTEDKDELRNRIRRIGGQVKGVERMIEDDRWCPDILQQIAAAQAALDKVALRLVDGHVQHCMREGADHPKRLQEMTDELMQALSRFVR
jgi:DNA-binding FrmR family transcriptional regulator